MNSEADIQLLESWLDGELSPADQQQLGQRLRCEPLLSAALADLRSQRALREGYFSSLVGDPELPDRLLSAARAADAQHQRLSVRWRIYRYAASAAACIALGFLAGHLTRPAHHPANLATGPAASPATWYNVSITDESGHVIAVQPFASPEQAQEFSQDIQRSQRRLQALESAPVTIRSAQF